MADAKLNVTIAGQCLIFGEWNLAHNGVYNKNSRSIGVWSSLDNQSVCIQEVDSNSFPCGSLHHAETIAEFRDVVRLIESEKFTFGQASAFLLSDGWLVQEGSVYRKGSNYIQIGEGVILQSFDIVGGGHGEVYRSDSLGEFKGLLYQFQGEMLKESLMTLGNVSKSLNRAIVRDFGEFAD